MTESDKRTFIEKYAETAMKHQMLYGIPASVTLAQLCLESSWGESYLFRNANNGFGIKVNDAWLKENKPYLVASDDHPDDKFRLYDSVESSLEDHAKVLKGARYSSCYSSPTIDYSHFAQELSRNGYATDPAYAKKLVNIIEKYNLSQYDTNASAYHLNPSEKSKVTLAFQEGHWSLPITPDATGRIEVAQQKNAIPDELGFKADHQPVFSTEDNGKVSGIGFDPVKGNFVSLSYPRADGSAYQVTFTHLDHISVKEGDVVQAQEQVGISGDTGRCSSPMLGMQVSSDSGGEQKAIPVERYLAEITLRGVLTQTVVKDGKDMLAEAKSQLEINDPLSAAVKTQDVEVPEGLDLSALLGSSNPMDWLKHLSELKKDGPLFGQGDIISELIGLMLSGLLAMASQFGPSKETNKEGEAKEHVEDNTVMQEDIVIKRQREGVNPAKATQLASLNFDAMSSEQQSTIVQRLN